MLKRELEQIDDDIETLRNAGYTVVVDPQATREDFIGTVSGMEKAWWASLRRASIGAPTATRTAQSSAVTAGRSAPATSHRTSSRRVCGSRSSRLLCRLTLANMEEGAPDIQRRRPISTT
jgi:hypothetical protein